MDILYIIGEGCSKCDNQELRYSLRSIERYGNGVSRVFVVGYCPEWLSDEVVKIPYEQPYKYVNSTEPNPEVRLAFKCNNIISSVLYAVDNSDIGDDFLVSMDDHLYIKKVDFDNYPYYVRLQKNGSILIPEEGKSVYRKCIVNTGRILREQGLSDYMLVMHRNMHCQRRVIEDCREFIEQGIKDNLLLEYLLYMQNYQYTKYGFEMTQARDVKIKNSGDWLRVRTMAVDVFSTADFVTSDRMNLLISNLYPKKSKYEK